MPLLRFLIPVACVLLAGCAKPELAHERVRAADAGALAAFRAELGQRHAPGELAAFDTAIQELQLAGMDRGLATADERAAAMRQQVNGKPVRAVEILGWQARHVRLRAEIREMTGLRDHNLMLREQSVATGTPQSVQDRIASANEVLDRLHQLLAVTEQQLAAWGAPAEPDSATRHER